MSTSKILERTGLTLLVLSILLLGFSFISSAMLEDGDGANIGGGLAFIFGILFLALSAIILAVSAYLKNKKR